MNDHYQVLIVGGGSAGITVAAYLRNEANPPEVAILEPSSKHYYQPIWTLVGAGVFDKSISERDEASVIPPGATWIQDAVAAFDPEHNQVTTTAGKTISYDYLVVTVGLQLNWDAIPGLKESVGKPGTGVCSNYSYGTVSTTWENIRNLKSGTALFTHPATPIKCGGAPQKICYLAEDHFARSGVRNNIDVIFCSAEPKIFAVEKYANTLNQVIARKKIDARFRTNLVALRPDVKEAEFENLDTGEKTMIKYDMIHVTPPQGPPTFIKESPLAGDGGWVSVNPGTTQHTKYANVFACGDCSNLPTSKTGAAIRKQAPTLAKNLMMAIHGMPPSAIYDGYTSCPLVTGYGSLVLAEFDYNKQPQETFPFDQSQERYSMYALKAYGLPQLYWHGMLRGRA
ncbi:MAG: NAD(P)/FAD-dependent oxidoreductase [Caldilineaceae bacterium]|nr:NAD(P)/FAD-dependent oxidoreductase [Caldilineaceae bacterium]